MLISKNLYLQGLNRSLLSSKPHIVVNLSEFDPTKLKLMDDSIRSIKNIKSHSFFIRGGGYYRIHSPQYFGKIKFENEVEVIGIDLSMDPFVVSFEDSEPMQDPHFDSPYTSKELLWHLLNDERSVIINKAMRSLFVPPNPSLMVPYTVILDRGTNRYIVKPFATIEDMDDTPRFFTSIENARKILGSQNYDGLYIRVQREELVNATQSEILSKLKKLNISIDSIKNWHEEENRQKKIFMIFDVIIKMIVIAIFILSLFASVLGFYHIFIVREASLIIVKLLGISKSYLASCLGVFYGLLLLMGFLLSLSLTILFSEQIENFFLAHLRTIIFLGESKINWDYIIFWGGILFLIYAILFLSPMTYLVFKRVRIKT